VASKRSRKKQQKLHGELLARLEELARRGEDERFLELASTRRRDLPAGALAARWDEVLERACSKALAAADFVTLERLLGRGRKGAPAPPLVRLGAAVVALGAGRPSAAREQLAELTGAGDELPESLARLRSRLMALAGGEADLPDGCPPELEDLLVLRRAIGERAADGATRRGSRRGAPPDLRGVAARAVWELLGGLWVLEGRGDGAPPPAELQRLRSAVAALAAEVPGGAPAAGLRRLSTELDLLAEVAALHRRRGRRARQPLSGRLAAWLAGPWGRRLEESSGGAPPPILVPVRRACHRLWRGLLEAVAREEGSRGLGELLAARPAPLAAEVEFPAAGSPVAGAEALRRGASARTLLAGGQWRELGRLLRQRGAREVEPGDLAALWSLELWALDREGEEEAEDDQEAPHHRALRRLEEMARGIEERFPRESRGEVARALRDELVFLCEQLAFCDHTLRAATALLAQLPDDAALLVAGLAGAVVVGEERARRRAEEGLARRGKLREGEREAVRRLLVQVALEDPADLARVLRPVQPLFAAEHWAEVREGVARELDGGFADVLQDAAELAAEGEEEMAALTLGVVDEKAAALRPLLAGTPVLGAVDLVLTACRAPARQAAREAQRFAGAFGDLPGLLGGLRLLGAAWGAASPPGVEAALAALAPAVIGRLDDRWPLWIGEIPFLAVAASGRDLAGLRRRLVALAGEAEGVDREAMERARAAVDEVARFQRQARRGGWRPPALPPAPEVPGEGPRRRKRRRPRAADDQLALDFERETGGP
jgi:hypothetical protein